MKVLILRLSSIGDVVHTLPCLVALNAGGWQVGWAVEPAARSLLEGHPLLSHVVAVPKARPFAWRAARCAARELRHAAYDMALDFQGLWKSALWGRVSGAPRLVGFARAWRREPLSSALVREHVALASEVRHVIDKNLALLRPLGIEAVGVRQFPLPPVDVEKQTVSAKLGALGIGEFAVLNPGGGWQSKLWPAEGFGAVARSLRERGLHPLVTWGPGEERLAQRVVESAEGAASKAPPTTLLELVELLRRARLVVAADTGPLHLACAVGTPVVGIYGPTDPARNGPFSPRDVVVRRTPLCSPCHRRRCSIHEGVMEAITPQEVLRAIDRRLGPAAGSLAV
jgi:lipopolysaccharide heptosyltransferase I